MSEERKSGATEFGRYVARGGTSAVRSEARATKRHFALHATDTDLPCRLLSMTMTGAISKLLFARSEVDCACTFLAARRFTR